MTTTESHLTTEQRELMQRCIDDGDTIAYVCTDAHGYPCNGGTARPGEHARPGWVQDLGPGRLVPCTHEALHGTHQPHRWCGSRVWVCAFGPVVVVGSDKISARRRTWIGEVLPHEALDPRVGVRLGRRDLAGADLAGADLDGSLLMSSALSDARLVDADLTMAELTGATLTGANLSGASLTGANLSGANLTRAKIEREWCGEISGYIGEPEWV